MKHESVVWVQLTCTEVVRISEMETFTFVAASAGPLANTIATNATPRRYPTRFRSATERWHWRPNYLKTLRSRGATDWPPGPPQGPSANPSSLCLVSRSPRDGAQGPRARGGLG